MVEVIDNAPPRTSTFLLDLAPADTMVYASMPNISEDLDAARAAFEARIASSTVLAEWWQPERRRERHRRRDLWPAGPTQPIGEAIGAEAVVAVPRTVIRGRARPLFMAELDDPQSFLTELKSLVEKANAEAGKTVVIIVENPLTADRCRSGGHSLGSAIIWLRHAGDLATLQALAERVASPAARDFIGTDIHSRLTEVYAGGVSWLMGVDLANAPRRAVEQAPPETVAAMDSSV